MIQRSRTSHIDITLGSCYLNLDLVADAAAFILFGFLYRSSFIGGLVCQ
jgi:hypothetical protein